MSGWGSLAVGKANRDHAPEQPKTNFFNFAASDVSVAARPRTKHKQRIISYIEYEVDALALKAEEGRGDRRNIQGELHTSEEP